MGGVLGKDGGGSPAQSTTTTSLPSFQQPAVREGIQGATDLFRSATPRVFPDSTVVPFNELQNLANTGILNFADQGAATGAQNAFNALNFQLTNAIDPMSNPFIQQAAQGAISPIFQQLTEQVLPSIRSGARATGQQGSSRQGIAEGLAIDRANESALDVTSRMFSDAYNRGLQAQQQALQLAPQTLFQTSLAPQLLQAGVGGQFADFQQKLLQDAISRFDFEQMQPFFKLNEFMNIAGRNFGQQTTGTQQAAQPSTAESIIGMGLQLLPFFL